MKLDPSKPVNAMVVDMCWEELGIERLRRTTRLLWMVSIIQGCAIIVHVVSHAVGYFLGGA